MEWRPMGAGDLLDAAFRGYRRFLAPCLLGYLLFCLPYVFLQAGMLLLTPTEPGSPGTWGAETLLGYLLALATVLLVGLAEGVCASTVLVAVKGESVSVRAILDSLKGRWFRLLGLVFVKNLFIGLGALLCLVPGIFLAINYAVAVPAAIAEDLGISEALHRSRELVSSSRGKTLGLLLLLWLLNMVLAMAIFTAIYGVAAALAGGFRTVFLGVPETLQWGNVVAEAGTRLLIPLGGLLWGYYYVDLRVRREAFDLTTAAERLSVPN